MKKVLVIAAAAMFIGSASYAQDVMKQTGGESNFEVQFRPLGGNPIGIGGIKFRKFTSATSAFRVTAFLGFNNSTDVTLGTNTDMTELKMTSSEFNISIAPGIESHFVGTDRLSPYIGGEAILGFASMSSKQEFLVADDVENNKTTDGSLTVGVNGFAGVDYYFADNIYLGFEFGFGIAFTSNFDTTTSSSVEGADDVETPNGSSIDVGPTVVSAIRLGFLF